VQSDGGVREATAEIETVYYYPTPIQESIVNMTDFGSWSGDSGQSIQMYAVSVTVPNVKVVWGINNPNPPYQTAGTLIGYTTINKQCTPRMLVVDYLGYGLPISESPYTTPQPCTTILTADAFEIAQAYTYTSEGTTKYYRHIGMLKAEYIGRYSGGWTQANHAAVSGLYGLYPGATQIFIKRVGNNVYPHKVRVVIDEDIDEWYTGKFTDAQFDILYYLADQPTYYTPYRSDKLLTEAYIRAQKSGTPSYDYYEYYYSCFQQNTRITLPVAPYAE
jgi:hypothetical protein